MTTHEKRLGQYFTPSDVSQSLVRWLELDAGDRLLDPSCGDGQFLQWHKRCVGIEVDPSNAARARENVPSALVHGGDFFTWADATKERFRGIAGNPPFIRYQSFTGVTRARALAGAKRLGADFSSLTSSWAPFLLVAAGLLSPEGRMAFVVPAEIGHASYARPLIRALCSRFERVHLIACREKFFPHLSEDCWVLSCYGYGRETHEVALTVVDSFVPSEKPPRVTRIVPLTEWETAGARLRPFILPNRILSLYRSTIERNSVFRLGQIASASVGYVTGGNDFFHLRPSEVARRDIPKSLLRVAIRKSEQLPEDVVEQKDIRRWIQQDDAVLLLNLSRTQPLPNSVVKYLDCELGHKVRTAYKCRNREPWYSVPDVVVPDAFLSVMCGTRPSLVRNDSGCVCTNTVHAVRFRPGFDAQEVQAGWKTPLAQLGAELEGHPLGGGMLKLEPREAAQIPVPIGPVSFSSAEVESINEGIITMRRWRHYD